MASPASRPGSSGSSSPIVPPSSSVRNENTEPVITIPKSVNFQEQSARLGLKLYSFFDRICNRLDKSWNEKYVQIREVNGESHWTTEKDLTEAVCRYLMFKEQPLQGSESSHTPKKLDQRMASGILKRCAMQMTLERVVDNLAATLKGKMTKEEIKKQLQEDLQTIEDVEILKKAPNENYTQAVERTKNNLYKVFKETEQRLADCVKVIELKKDVNALISIEATIKKIRSQDDGTGNKQIPSEKLMKKYDDLVDRLENTWGLKVKDKSLIHEQKGPSLIAEGTKIIEAVKKSHAAEFDLIEKVAHQTLTVDERVKAVLARRNVIPFNDLLEGVSQEMKQLNEMPDALKKDLDEAFGG
jgi:hypothetical protein